MDETKSLHLRGPKMFSLERLCFIFLKIVHPKCCIDDSIFAQVNFSVHLLKFLIKLKFLRFQICVR